jgi:hypothetical protein
MGSGQDTQADTTFGGSGTDADTGSFDSSGGGGPEGACSLWVDECGAGRKCMPYSVLEDRVPDEVKCCDAVPNPHLVGENCEITDYDGSCLDSCEVGSMCVLDDDETKSGLCRKFCQPSGPDCEPEQTCKSFFETIATSPTVPLCMDKCDPLVQDCTPSTWKCIPDAPTDAGQSGFICVPPPPTPERAVFDACGLANDCEAGLVCIGEDRVPSCPFTSCCTAFCSLSEGDGPCQALHPDLQCVDWMSAEPSWQDVGACAIPT